LAGCDFNILNSLIKISCKEILIQNNFKSIPLPTVFEVAMVMTAVWHEIITYPVLVLSWEK